MSPRFSAVEKLPGNKSWSVPIGLVDVPTSTTEPVLNIGSFSCYQRHHSLHTYNILNFNCLTFVNVPKFYRLTSISSQAACSSIPTTLNTDNFISLFYLHKAIYYSYTTKNNTPVQTKRAITIN